VYTPDRYIYTTEIPAPWLHLGVTEADILPQNGARPIDEVCTNVRKIVKGNVVVGHAVKNDVKVFPPWVFYDVELRDTQILEEYRNHSACQIQRMPKLFKLAQIFLGRPIQPKEHSSVEDAVATMELYRLCAAEIERTQKVVVKFDMYFSLRLFNTWVENGTYVAALKDSIRSNSTSPGELADFVLPRLSICYAQRKLHFRLRSAHHCVTKLFS
jgi:RNA exonuclease 4